MEVGRRKQPKHLLSKFIELNSYNLTLFSPMNAERHCLVQSAQQFRFTSSFNGDCVSGLGEGLLGKRLRDMQWNVRVPRRPLTVLTAPHWLH